MPLSGHHVEPCKPKPAAKLSAKLYVLTDARLRQLFSAACKIRGVTIQAEINSHMGQFVRDCGLGQQIEHQQHAT